MSSDNTIYNLLHVLLSLVLDDSYRVLFTNDSDTTITTYFIECSNKDKQKLVGECFDSIDLITQSVANKNNNKIKLLLQEKL